MEKVDEAERENWTKRRVNQIEEENEEEDEDNDNN